MCLRTPINPVDPRLPDAVVMSFSFQWTFRFLPVGKLTMPIAEKLVVWHDGACPLCRQEIALIRRLYRAGRIDFQDATNPETSCPLDRGTMLARFHAMENGVLLSGAAAFAAMWRAIPVLWLLGQLARVRVIERALDRAYSRFLQVRPRLQDWFR